MSKESRKAQSSVHRLANWLHLSLVSKLANLSDNCSVYNKLVHYVVGVLEEDVVCRCNSESWDGSNSSISEEEGEVHKRSGVEEASCRVKDLASLGDCRVDFVVHRAGSLHIKHEVTHGVVLVTQIIVVAVDSTLVK